LAQYTGRFCYTYKVKTVNAAYRQRHCQGSFGLVKELERRYTVKHKNGSRWVKLATVAIIILMMACSTISTLSPTPTTSPSSSPIVSPTPTPTKVNQGAPEVQLSPTASKCEGLSGELEMQVLVGPAEVVGLEPYVVGEIPFSVVSGGDTYIVEGGGAIVYQQVLEEDWGTYTVSLDMQSTIDGTCGGDAGSEVLNMTIEMSGEQIVEVRAEGFQGDYPWTGTHELNLSFPLEDGATANGEGWTFVLHLNP
jgi:hypothetical protein